MSKQDISPVDELKSVIENPIEVEGVSYRIPGFPKGGINVDIKLDNGVEHSLSLEKNHAPIVHKDSDGNIYIYEITDSWDRPDRNWYTKFNRTAEIVTVGERSKGFFHQMIS